MCSKRRGLPRRGIYYGLGRCWGTLKPYKMAAIGLHSKLAIVKKRGKLKLFYTIFNTT